MRILVEIDVNLKRGKKIKVMDGELVKAEFKYERLNLFCFVCGRLGQTESSCDVVFESRSYNVERKLEHSLKAIDPRKQDQGGDRWLREDSNGGQEFADGSGGAGFGGDTRGVLLASKSYGILA